MDRCNGNAGEHASSTVGVTKVYRVMSKVIRNKVNNTGFRNKNYSVYF